MTTNKVGHPTFLPMSISSDPHAAKDGKAARRLSPSFFQRPTIQQWCVSIIMIMRMGCASTSWVSHHGQGEIRRESLFTRGARSCRSLSPIKFLRKTRQAESSKDRSLVQHQLVDNSHTETMDSSSCSSADVSPSRSIQSKRSMSPIRSIRIRLRGGSSIRDIDSRSLRKMIDEQMCKDGRAGKRLPEARSKTPSRPTRSLERPTSSRSERHLGRVKKSDNSERLSRSRSLSNVKQRSKSQELQSRNERRSVSPRKGVERRGNTSRPRAAVARSSMNCSPPRRSSRRVCGVECRPARTLHRSKSVGGLGSSSKQLSSRRMRRQDSDASMGSKSKEIHPTNSTTSAATDGLPKPTIVRSKSAPRPLSGTGWSPTGCKQQGNFDKLLALYPIDL